MPAKDSHVNKRGNTEDRRRRRLWLLDPDSGFGGDGAHVPCWECGTLVDYVTMVVDRYIVPGWRGGGYQRWNIAPQCHVCADKQSHLYRRAAQQQRKTGRRRAA